MKDKCSGYLDVPPTPTNTITNKERKRLPLLPYPILEESPVGWMNKLLQLESSFRLKGYIKL